MEWEEAELDMQYGMQYRISRSERMRKRLVWTHGSLLINNDGLWVMPFYANILCNFDLRNNKLQKCFIWEQTHIYKGASYGVVGWQNKVVMIPYRDNVIRVISKDKLIQEYLIDESASLCEHYHVTLSWHDKLFIFPVAASDIVELSEREIRKIFCPLNTVISATVYCDGIFIITDDGYIWKYDTTLEQVEQIMSNEKNHFCWMEVWQNNIVFATKEGMLLLAEDGDMKKLVEIGRAPEHTFFSNGIVGTDNILLFLNEDAERIYSFCFSDRQMYECRIEKDKYWNEDWTYNAFGKPCINDGKIYVMSPKHRALLVLDEKGRILERKYLLLDVTRKIGDEIANQGFSVSNIIEENELLALREYLKYVQKS